jgi:hypothetical protein
MGLTILAFVSLPGFVAFFLLAVRRGRALPGRAEAAAIAAILAVYSILQGLVFVFTGQGFPQSVALSLERLSGALLVITHALVLLFALNFPSPLHRAPRALARAAVLLIALFSVYEAGFTYDYIISVYRPWATIFRIEGRYYDLFVFGDAALAGLAAIVLGLRALASPIRVQRQKAAVATVFVIAGSALIFVSTGLLTAGQAKRPSFVFAPAGALLLAGGIAYAFRLAHLFDWRVIGRTLLGYAALFGVVGLPAGLAAAGLSSIARTYVPLVAVLGTPLVFVAATIGGRLLASRFFKRIVARGDYREGLASDLAHIDLSRGRDSVLADLYACLVKGLDFQDFSVLIDDDQGFLRTIYASTGAKAAIEPGSALRESLEVSASSILLRSEAETFPDYSEVRADLLQLFESLKAEALIVMREGGRAIGLFALGSRSTGADYTAYDYGSFKAIYGKLFAIAYYLKNVARESIITTVDREIALSDQIIRFAFEKIDKIDHPKTDAAWLARSARGLGGDFIDFVQLSEERWFFVMGDVSGKGLSASMNMLILKSMIRSFLHIEKDFVGLVARVNSFIKENLPKGTFFAGVFGYFDLSTDAFFYVNCGIPVLLMYTPSFDTFIEIQGEGRILGFVKDVRPFLKPRRLALARGSALVASTDGILEGENLRGESFGKDRLRRSIRSRLELSADEAVKGALEDMLTFTDRRQDDDITLFVMKLRSAK